MPDAPTRRVFFALWPPPALTDEIVPRAARLGLGGYAVARERLHLTLAFYPQVSASGIKTLCERAAALETSSFTLVIDRLDGFVRSRTLWFGPSRPPQALTALASALAPPQAPGVDRATFVPHITVRRAGAPPVPRALFPSLIWRISRFSLVESGASSVPGCYRVLAEWPLGGRASMK